MPWRALGISRATWYRQRKAERERTCETKSVRSKEKKIAADRNCLTFLNLQFTQCQTSQRRKPMQDDTFGLCPICHKTDGCANAGRSHIFYCNEHKTSWCVGSNLFSGWRKQTEEEQRKIWNEIGLEEFQDVRPYFHPRRAKADATRRRKAVSDEPCPF